MEFEPTTPPNIERYGAPTGVVVKEDGTRSVVFGGGVTSTQEDYSCEMFDPVAESWRSCPDTPHILVAPSRYSNKSLSIVQYVSEIAFHPPAFLMATPLSPSEAAKEATPDTPMPYTGISVAQLGFQTVQCISVSSFDPEEEDWTKLPAILTSAKETVVAVPIPEGFVPCVADS